MNTDYNNSLLKKGKCDICGNQIRLSVIKKHMKSCEKKLKELNELKLCKKCKSEFIPSKGLKNYCSVLCCKSHEKSKESKKKSSENTIKWFNSIEGNKQRQRLRERRLGKGPLVKKGDPFKEISCTNCKNAFVTPRKKDGTYRSWCSDECYLSIKRKNAKGIKRKTYNGFIFDSGFEVKIAKFLDENGVKWIQPKDAIKWIDKDGKERKYFPDFYLPYYDLYLDPKNWYCIQKQKEKLDIVSNIIKLFYGDPEEIKTRLYSVIGNIPEYESGEVSVRL